MSYVTSLSLSQNKSDYVTMQKCHDTSTEHATFRENVEMLFYNKSELHPFRNYSVTLKSYTSCWGYSSSVTIVTDEAGNF